MGLQTPCLNLLVELCVVAVGTVSSESSEQLKVFERARGERCVPLAS